MIKNRISVIIPCYNHEHFLTTAINSVLEQTHEDIEIIIVDDGSTPPLNPLNYKPDWLIFIRQENKGLPAARNAGIKAASGEWILPLDADDKIAPTFLEKALALTERAHIVSTGLQQFGARNGYSMPLVAPTHKDFLIKNRINCCSLYRRSMWEKLGGYDEKMRDGYEDWDFWLRATNAGYVVRVIQELLFFYRKHNQRTLLNHAQANRAKILEYMRTKFPTVGKAVGV